MQTCMVATMAGRNLVIERPAFNPSTHAFCTKCRQVKSRTAFPKNRTNKNGLHHWCTECNNAGIQRWEDANYRKRRDAQAMWARKVNGSTKTGPVDVKHAARVPRTQAAAS